MHNGVKELTCSECGTIFYLRKSQSYPLCRACRKKNTLALRRKYDAIAKELDVRTKYEIRFDNAVNKVLSNVKDESKWNKAIECAERASDKYGSVPEAMMAIILAKAKLPFIPQQKIGTYHVDFCIPKVKTIIEVDGSLYHKDKQKELEREGSIQYNVGLEWNIIHVPAEAIENNINRIYKWMCNVRDTGDRNVE